MQKKVALITAAALFTLLGYAFWVRETAPLPGWKIYRNERYGFQISYPPEYVVEENPNKKFILRLARQSLINTDYAGLSDVKVYIQENPSESFDVYKDNLRKNIETEVAKFSSHYSFQEEAVNGVPVIFHKRDFHPFGAVGNVYNMYADLGNGRALSFESEADHELLDKMYRSLVVFGTSTPRETVVDPRRVSITEWGISFLPPRGWSFTRSGDRTVTLRGGEETILIAYSEADIVSDFDAKFGPVLYQWDETARRWLQEGDDISQRTGEVLPPVREAVPDTYLADETPVFLGRTRWLTYIVPLSKSTFLTLTITGSGDTQPLRDFIKTIRRI